MAKWGGRRARRLVALCLATYGDVCHLAGPMCKGKATTADHLVTRSAGGPDTIANVRPACLPCNQARSNLPLDSWRQLYPVRRSVVLEPSRPWHSHMFAVSPTRGGLACSCGETRSNPFASTPREMESR